MLFMWKVSLRPRDFFKISMHFKGSSYKKIWKTGWKNIETLLFYKLYYIICTFTFYVYMQSLIVCYVNIAG